MAKESRKGDALARMTRGREIDLLIVAECALSTTAILESMSSIGLEFYSTGLPHQRIRFFRRLSCPELIPVLSDDRFDFVRLTAEGFEEILIGATHLYGRHHVAREESRHAKLLPHLMTLADAEKKVGHDRTLLVGDFNMTPDEFGMVGHENSLGAMMTWDLAQIHSLAAMPVR